MGKFQLIGSQIKIKNISLQIGRLTVSGNEFRVSKVIRYLMGVNRVVTPPALGEKIVVRPSAALENIVVLPFDQMKKIYRCANLLCVSTCINKQ